MIVQDWHAFGSFGGSSCGLARVRVARKGMMAAREEILRCMIIDLT